MSSVADTRDGDQASRDFCLSREKTAAQKRRRLIGDRRSRNAEKETTAQLAKEVLRTIGRVEDDRCEFIPRTVSSSNRRAVCSSDESSAKETREQQTNAISLRSFSKAKTLKSFQNGLVETVLCAQNSVLAR